MKNNTSNTPSAKLLIIIYISFISLGLPDSILGSAWPSMYNEFSVPLSYAGIISMIIALGTVISSLQSHRITKMLGTGKVTTISVLITAVSLLGFAISNSFILLILWAIPYGLGAGGVDASINSYVALHYKSRHMSWLHCMWGIGAAIGPSVMRFVLSHDMKWNKGYSTIGFLQIVLTCILILNLALWNNTSQPNNAETNKKIGNSNPILLKDVIKIKGVKEVMLCFFCYCAIEQTTSLWVSSYMALEKGLPTNEAAGFGSMFFIGITVGRAISGFITFKLNDNQMIKLGQLLIGTGIIIMLLPFGQISAIIGLIIIGLGCAPIYPCIIHSTPERFGADRSQSVIGVQMASAYVGTCIMPPIFGIIAEQTTIALLPFYLLVILIIMIFMNRSLIKKIEQNPSSN